MSKSEYDCNRCNPPDSKVPVANDRQVGGTHYKGKSAAGREHWDLVAEFGWNYFQGQIIRYVMRYKDKNGIQDLEKAQHYLQKLIELEQAEWTKRQGAKKIVLSAGNPALGKFVGAEYLCGCPFVPSDKVEAFCPTHLQPMRVVRSEPIDTGRTELDDQQAHAELFAPGGTGHVWHIGPTHVFCRNCGSPKESINGEKECLVLKWENPNTPPGDRSGS